MSDDNCGMCGLPIDRSASDLRHFGFFVAHSERDCIGLLQADLASLREQLAAAQAEAVAFSEALKLSGREKIAAQARVARCFKRLSTFLGDPTELPTTRDTPEEALVDAVLARAEAAEQAAGRLQRRLKVDVLLPPATIIRAGCTISAVVTGLSQDYRSDPPAIDDVLRELENKP